MRYPELHYRWAWDLQSSPERLWPFVADTDRFNRDTGLPALQPEAGQALLGGRRRLRFRKLGMPIEWEEEPFEWVRPERFSVVRRYSRGPVASLHVLVTLERNETGGTRLIYESRVRARNPIGFAGLPAVMGILNRRAFEAAVRRYDRLASTAPDEAPAIPHPAGGNPRMAPGGRERLTEARRALLLSGADPALVPLLLDHVANRDELDLGAIRPYALARAWGVEGRPVLELCLLATRAGLLDLQWNVLCPYCRGAPVSSGSLAGVAADVHCGGCDIDFTADFERSVELTFRPNPAVREVERRVFCIGGPEVTPHVVAQQFLRPGEERTIEPRLEPGRYRLRARSVPGGAYLDVAPGGAGSIRVDPDSGWAPGETCVSEHLRLALTNDGAEERLFVLERTEWADDATTAAEVIALQLFRDLFSTEILRPREQFSVGSLTVVFTDLRDSTRLYREIGDAPAFGRVLDHFDVLREAVAAEGGTVVKTIGDAIMGVFRRPASAVRALLAAQGRLAAHEGRPLNLKAGMHHGHCIAVTMNERLDYFGSTVNMASRLERFSSGDDIIVSDVVRHDPEVEALLAADGGHVAEAFDAELKGFDNERFRLWRLRAVEAAMTGDTPASKPGATSPEASPDGRPALPGTGERTYTAARSDR